MKSASSLFVLGALLGCTGSLHSLRTVASQSATPAGRSPVIVELFTSEGCSSCPPADALLSKLEVDQPIAGAEIIGLEEHVDYWNHDGWTDPYSSGEWTSRQQEYVTRLKSNSPYTPQMIVDGQKEFVGNNVREAEQTIQHSARQEKIGVAIAAGSSLKSSVLGFEVRVADVRGAGEEEKSDVWLAVTEAGLRTAVSAGENKGRSWEHASIVRSLQKIGSISSNSSVPFLARPQVKLRPSWKKENLRFVVFVQERRSWRILGAAWASVACLRLDATVSEILPWYRKDTGVILLGFWSAWAIRKRIRSQRS
jgi:hypothetical protein